MDHAFNVNAFDITEVENIEATGDGYFVAGFVTGLGVVAIVAIACC
ncbi:MAG: hypothetical protein FWH52_00140 [Synergistaceae bacterium]|nr:hypothetical protein [Synergistaceae bacterium]